MDEVALSGRERDYLLKMCGGDAPSHILHAVKKARTYANKMGSITFEPAHIAIIALMAEEMFREKMRSEPVAEDAQGRTMRIGQPVICTRDRKVVSGVVKDGMPDGAGLIRVELSDGSVVRISPKNIIAMDPQNDQL